MKNQVAILLPARKNSNKRLKRTEKSSIPSRSQSYYQLGKIQIIQALYKWRGGLKNGRNPTTS